MERQIKSEPSIFSCFFRKGKAGGFRSKILSGLACAAAFGCAALPETITLEDGTGVMEITPALGGRVLSFSLKGRENLLKVGEAVTSIPDPKVSAEVNSIDYFGHIVWVGPQNDWWTQQGVNSERFNAKATWPPDPYLILAGNKIVERSPGGVVLKGVESPVSGLQLRKMFSLLNGKPGTVELGVEAINVSGKTVSWDIWFNTRVQPLTRVYVPVASNKDVRVVSSTNETTGPVEYSLTDGLLTFDLTALPGKITGRKGKIFIQPSAGWMAGFAGGQVFIIEFPLQPREAIHHEQGQVELYLNYQPENLKDSLIEMEVHAPYRTLRPGESMQAAELWTVLPYDGPDEKTAHVNFLEKRFNLDR